MVRPRLFADYHCVVLMLIFEEYPDLAWVEAAEVFNLVLRDQRTEAPRTEHVLVNEWHHRNHDRSVEWEAHRALANPDDWTPAIAAALREYRNHPDRPLITPPSQSRSGYNQEMRLAIHLLMKDKSLKGNPKLRIFNALFADRMDRLMTKDGFSAEYTRRKRKAGLKEKAAMEAVASGTSKRKHSEIDAKPTPFEQWQSILRESKTPQDLEAMNDLKNKIEELKGVETYPEPAVREEPLYDPTENVGHWRFVNDVDEEWARIQLGGQVPGMPARPTAADVQRHRLQWARAERFAYRLRHIRIVPASPEDEAEANATTQEVADVGFNVHLVVQPVARRPGQWRFATDGDEDRAAVRLGGVSGMPLHPSAWEVRQYWLREYGAGRDAALMEGIYVEYVYNTRADEPSEPELTNTPRGLTDVWRAATREFHEYLEKK